MTGGITNRNSTESFVVGFVKEAFDTIGEFVGLDFERGKAVEVSDDRIIEKLKNNSQFEQVKRGRPRVVNES